MLIYLDELDGTLTWDYRANKKHVISAVRLWLYKHLSPAGDFNVVIKQSGETIATSETITSAYIETNSDATALNYSHGYVTFNFTNPFILNQGVFTVELVPSGGYSFSESAYIGWVKPHEDNLFTPSEFSNAASINPYGIQFWEYRSKL